MTDPWDDNIWNERPYQLSAVIDGKSSLLLDRMTVRSQFND